MNKHQIKGQAVSVAVASKLGSYLMTLAHSFFISAFMDPGKKAEARMGHSLLGTTPGKANDLGLATGWYHPYMASCR